MSPFTSPGATTWYSIQFGGLGAAGAGGNLSDGEPPCLHRHQARGQPEDFLRGQGEDGGQIKMKAKVRIEVKVRIEPKVKMEARVK